jgi:hypothetical protein
MSERKSMCGCPFDRVNPSGGKLLITHTPECYAAYLAANGIDPATLPAEQCRDPKEYDSPVSFAGIEIKGIIP